MASVSVSVEDHNDNDNDDERVIVTFVSNDDDSDNNISIDDDDNSDEIYPSTNVRRRSSYKRRRVSYSTDDIDADIEADIENDNTGDQSIVDIKNDNTCDQSIVIRWKKQDYRFKRLSTYRTNLQDIFDRACSIGKLDGTSISIVSSPFLRRKLEALRTPLFEAFRAILEAYPRPRPHRMHQVVNRAAGCYGLSVGSHGTCIKYGMSFQCFKRADRQAPGFAFQLADCKYLRNHVIPASCIREIEKLDFPGIACHPDHIERIRDLIAMHIQEGYLVAAHSSTKKSVANTQKQNVDKVSPTKKTRARPRTTPK